jgi:hypothetical protein
MSQDDHYEPWIMSYKVVKKGTLTKKVTLCFLEGKANSQKGAHDDRNQYGTF